MWLRLFRIIYAIGVALLSTAAMGPTETAALGGILGGILIAIGANGWKP
jgi:hypothetical protein